MGHLVVYRLVVVCDVHEDCIRRGWVQFNAVHVGQVHTGNWRAAVYIDLLAELINAAGVQAL